MLRFFKNKIFLLAAIFVFVAYLSNDFSLIDIKETAIVVALGVDKEDDIYEVSAQIVVPQATEQAASNQGTTVSGKGKTVALAIENIGVHTGWYPKLSFCNVIILGEGVFDGDIMESIDYFIRTIKIQDTAELCAAEKTAKEILTATSPLDELPTFSVTKILQKDAESSSTVSYSSLREFAMGYYSKSGFSQMPLLKIIADAEGGDVKGNQATSFKIKSTADSSSGSESGSNGQGQKKQLFDATSTLLFTNGKRAYVMPADQTAVYNLLKHRVTETSVELSNAQYNGKETNLMISIRDNSGKIKLKIENSRPTLHVSLSVKARIDDTDISVSPSDLVSGFVVPESVLRDLEKKLADTLTDIFEATKASGCDVFEVRDRLFRTQNKYYEGYQKLILDETSVAISVTAKSFK